MATIDFTYRRSSDGWYSVYPETPTAEATYNDNPLLHGRLSKTEFEAFRRQATSAGYVVRSVGK